MPGESLEATVARLCERSDSILRELTRIGKQVDSFGPTAGQLVQAVAELHEVKAEIDKIHPELRQVVLDLTTLKVQQRRTTEKLTRRQQWTYGLATILVGGGLTIFLKLLGF